MAQAHKGNCFCGAVEIEVTGDPVEMAYCHCSDCRAWSGTPVATATLWNRDQVAITRGEELLAGYNKAGFSDRQHCTRCGGHVVIFHPTLGMADVPAGVLPTLPFKPTVHLNYVEAVLPIRDGLPKQKDFPGEAGGSGETVPE